MKANKLIREQQSFQYISEQFNRLEDRYEFVIQMYKEIKDKIAENKLPINDTFDNEKKEVYLDETLTKEILYSIILIKELKSLIELKEIDKEMLLKKLKLLYDVKYKDNLTELKATLLENVNINPKENLNTLIAEINNLEKNVTEIN